MLEPVAFAGNRNDVDMMRQAVWQHIVSSANEVPHWPIGKLLLTITLPFSSSFQCDDHLAEQARLLPARRQATDLINDEQAVTLDCTLNHDRQVVLMCRCQPQ